MRLIAPALPESWPVSVPAPEFSDRFMVRLREPVGPVTNAPMLDPSSAVTCPLSWPKVTSLRWRATPPFTAGR